MKRSHQERTSRERSPDRTEHLAARQEHAAWLRKLERWRIEYQEAIREFAQRLLPELELGNFEDALDRHEAAIQAHEDLVVRHERMSRTENYRAGEITAEYEELHQQMHDRHELSRTEHAKLARAHRAILEAMAMMGKKTSG